MAASLVHLLLSWGISVAEGVPRRSEKEGARRTVATRGTAGCRRKAALAAPGAAVCVPLAALLVADDCGDLRQLRGCPHPAPAPRGAERRCGRIGVVAINDWWSADPAERFWMETTGRNDLGAELHAPQLNGAGRREWGYALVAETRPGDVVFHWHKSLAGRPALVGCRPSLAHYQSTRITAGCRRALAAEHVACQPSDAVGGCRAPTSLHCSAPLMGQRWLHKRMR